MVKTKRSRTVGLQTKLARVAEFLNPFFTSSQLAEAAKVSRDQASKMCTFWASKGLIKVVGNIRLEYHKRPMFVYTKTDDFIVRLLAFQPSAAQKDLFEAPPVVGQVASPKAAMTTSEPPKAEPSKVIMLKQRPNFAQRIDDFIDALDILRDACTNLKEGT